MEVLLKQGDRITIPDGCKAAIEGNEVVIEKEKMEFKRGDVITGLHKEILLVDIYNFDGHLLSSFVNIDKCGKLVNNPYQNWNEYHDWRLATEEEKQLLFDKMTEQGLQWNAEEKKVEKIRWRSEIDGSYYLFTPNCNIYNSTDIRSPLDDRRYSIGNYFRTKEQAEKAAEVVKEALKKFHEENK